jgi:hypothetical protein
MKKIFLVLTLCVLFVGLASAANDFTSCIDDPIKAGNNATLYQICSNCTYVNISSVVYPDGTVESINNEMTKNDVTYTYDFTNTSTAGRYLYTVKGDKDGSVKTETICFDVNPSGFFGTTSFYIIFLIISIGIIVIGFSIKDGWTVVIGSFAMMLFGLFVLLYGIDGIKDAAYTYGISIITIMIGAYFGIRAAMDEIY